MTQPGNAVALPDDFETGLEDFDMSSAALPRIQIVHTEGVFKDGQTNEEFPKMYAVFLGLIAQRVFWAKEQEQDSKPLCKSNDGETGYPNVTGPNHSLFPWAQSGLNPQAVPKDDYGRPVIKCENCVFKDWGPRGANGKSSPPPCSERYTMPLLFSVREGGQLDHAGILSVQRSGIGPFKSYIGAFKRAKAPLFAAYTDVSLSTNKRGTVVYSTPVVARRGETDPEAWAEWADTYRNVRELLRRPPAPPKDADGNNVAQASDNTWNPGGAQPTSGAPVVEAEVVDDPWASTAPAQAEPAAAPASVMTGGLIAAASNSVSSMGPGDDDDLPF